MKLQDCYRNRFSDVDNENKNVAWVALCENFLSNYVSEKDTVLDIGAGYCNFINNIKCQRKIAVDLNPDTKKYADKDVEVVQRSAIELPARYDDTIDVIFISNFLEHLDSKEQVIQLLEKVNKLLKKGGKLLIIQPNIDLVKEAYWDFIDHKVALNEKSLREALELAGFQVNEFIKKFLPYTTTGNLIPNINLAIKVYLLVPEFMRLNAGQSFVLATKTK